MSRFNCKVYISIYLLLLFVLLCNDCVFGNEGPELSDVDKITKFGVYYKMDDAKAAYSTPEAKNQNVDRLIEEFERRCEEPLRVTNPEKAYPFIVVEGVHRTTRSIVGHKLAKRMSAQIVPNPPKYMAVLSEKFPTGVIFRKAFFAIGIYGAGCEARDIVSSTPVVINGHWLFQASFAIAKTFNAFPPPPTSPIYHWPKDLFKPDLVFFINSPLPSIVPTPRSNEFRPILIETFRRWRDPKIIELNSTQSYDELTNLAIRHINKEFGTNYNPESDPEDQQQEQQYQ